MQQSRLELLNATEPNFSTITEGLRTIAERKLGRQREVEQPRPKNDRGMRF